MKIGVVSGLRRESACFDCIPRAQRDFETFAGVGPERAARGAEALIDAGARGLVSFGLAGSLAVAAQVGGVVLAEAVIDGDQLYPTDAVWRNQIRRSISGTCEFIHGTLAGTDRIISTSNGKQNLHRNSAAIACDMESHAVARIAARHGVPFVVIRAISDAHDRFVPSWAIQCLTPAGDVQIWSLLCQVLRRPGCWRNLAGLSQDSKSAFDSLRRVALGLGPGLHF